METIGRIRTTRNIYTLSLQPAVPAWYLGVENIYIWILNPKIPCLYVSMYIYIYICVKVYVCFSFFVF